MMEAKAFSKGLAAAALCALLALSAFGVSAFASDEGASGDLTTETPAEIEPGEGQKQDQDQDQEEVQETIPDRGNLAAGTYYFQSASSSVMRVLSYSGKSTVLASVATATSDQRWSVSVGKDGFAHVKNVKSGKVLAVSGGVAKAGARVVLAAEKAPSDPAAPGSAQQHENLAQKWVVTKASGKYALVSALDGAFALTIAGKSASPAYGATLKKLSNGKAQLFSALAPGKVKRSIANRSALGKGTYYIQLPSVETCVLGAKGEGVRLTSIAGESSQRWKLTVGRDGYAKLANVGSGKVLSVKGGKAAKGAAVCLRAEKPPADSNAAGTVLAQEGLYQKWVVKKRAGKLTIVSALDRNYALGIASRKSGYAAELQKADAKSERQRLTFIASKPTAAKKGSKTVKNGVYLLAPTARATQAVSIAGAARKSGANARISAFAASTKQAFRVTYDKRGFYSVVNAYSGKHLVPAATCSVPGVNVVQGKLGRAGLDRGKWRIDKLGSGYRLVNKATGLALEMADSKHADGSNVQAATAAKASAQRFALVSPSSLSPAASKVKGTFYITMRSSSRSVVGAHDDSRMEGASVNVRAKRNTNVQRLAIKSSGTKGAYYLQNVATDRVVSLDRQSKSKTVNVVMRNKTGAPYQLWRVVYNDDFSYAFENAYSSAHLHVVGGNAGEGTNIRTAAAKPGSSAQRFRLSKTSARTDEVVTLDVPCYLQNPELPTGCESVACTNALRYWGFKLAKTTIANWWMPYGSDGVWDFIGNPHDSSGWIICAPGIADTANSYLRDRGAAEQAWALKGHRLSSLCSHLDRGEPVIVWTTIGMGYPGTVQWWNSGYPLRSNNHAVVLAGYDPNTGEYLVADSLAGVVWRDGDRFEWLYNEMGRQAVVINR